MAHIHIQEHHSLSAEAARLRVDEIARSMQERFGASYEWSGNTLNFQRSGVTGSIEIGEKEITVDAELSGMFGVFKGEVERQVRGFIQNNMQ